MKAPVSESAVELALEIIKEFEGLSLEAYQCSAGKWTIGYGQTGPGIKKDTVWTLNIANDRLEHYVRPLMDVVRDAAYIPLTDNQLAALTSLAYNIGTAAFLSSSVVASLKQGQVIKAADAITLWNKVTNPKTLKKEFSPGLAKRRLAERALFIKK